MQLRTSTGVGLSAIYSDIQFTAPGQFRVIKYGNKESFGKTSEP